MTIATKPTSLGSLADATAHHDDIALPADPTPFVAALERMWLIRVAEERLADAVAEGTIKCPCHLAIGQEAPPVGVSMHLRSTDRAFGAHRSHGHYLALTGDVHSLFAETLGRETGASRGMGGSMHLIARDKGFHGSVPIVGATIPIAVGAALAAKMDGRGDVAVSYFGDGATEEGVFHESMNLASTMNLPVLFVCENNMFSSHLHIDLRQPSNSVVRYAAAHHVPYARVDGNDVVEVARVAGEAINRMRVEGGPFFLECVTYRWRGHVGHREDEDVGVKRKDDLALWKKRDPIARLSRALEKTGVLTLSRSESIPVRLRVQAQEAWARAIADPFPGPEALLERTLTRSSRSIGANAGAQSAPKTAGQGRRTGYGVAIREGFEYLLSNYPEVFTIGQGLWSPWYVGNSMTNLDKQFGIERVIDTPVSELATTGAALGASLCGHRAVVIHPRIDFMLLATDQIVTQAAKWRSMFGGQVSAQLTIRGIINRGGEQGAQHSQALHSWFAHIPGLRVVMPATPSDARDLLIASVLCDDPVLYMDDRWLYEQEEELAPVGPVSLDRQGPRVVRAGDDITLVGCGYTSLLCRQAADRLASQGVSAEVIDLRVLSPLEPSVIIASVAKTNRMVVADGDWRSFGMAGEIIALAAESRAPEQPGLRVARITHPDAPAPTSRVLEQSFYFSSDDIVRVALGLMS